MQQPPCHGALRDRRAADRAVRGVARTGAVRNAASPRDPHDAPRDCRGISTPPAARAIGTGFAKALAWT
jgi:hypothetical protein